MKINEGEKPLNHQQRYQRTEKGRARNAKYNRSEKGKNRKRIYRPKASQARYDATEFVAWDGEGLTEKDGSHTYVMLANSDGKRLSDRTGLGTVETLEFMLDSRKEVVNIIYGGNYDVNMILKDVGREDLETLYRTGQITWAGYWIKWRPGKMFHVIRGPRKFLLYDVISFYQKSFVDACDEYLGTDWEGRDDVIREKANRSTFREADLQIISEYNDKELSTLVLLQSEFKKRLSHAGIRIRRWDGPGAIAAAIYTENQTKSHINTLPPGPAEAAQYSYAGGRFEIIRKGHSESPAWEYDIRSAYPSALRSLPCLTHGEWRYVTNVRRVARFGIYHIEITQSQTGAQSRPQPLWQRNVDGTVYYSEYPYGWYWSPEAKLVFGNDGAVFHEGWEYYSRCDCDPFGFVNRLYLKRAALKKSGDGAHIMLKLGLNSLYGKLAQQVGWIPGDPPRLPPYHCLAWAGYVTSHCRAQIYRAALQAWDDIIAFETDALFSRVPLDLPLTEKLGDWEETKFSSLTYFKSGMYFGTKDDGTEVERMRGVNRGSVNREDVIAALKKDAAGEYVVIEAEQTRFITIGQALHQDFSKWRRWITAPRILSVALDGKRIDLMNPEESRKEIGDGWLETQEGRHATEHSYPYVLAWINPDAYTDKNGLTMEEVKQMGYEYYD